MSSTLMPAINVLAVLVAAVVVFVIAGAYYAALSSRMATLSPAYAEERGMGPALVVGELVRGAVVAGVVAGLSRGLGLDGVGPALLLALALWVAFPAVLLSGSVIHERVRPQLAAIHAGDWALKLLVITVIVTVWR